MAFVDDLLVSVGLKPGALDHVHLPSGQTLFGPPGVQDDPTNSQSFTLASGSRLDVPLGFRVGSVVIDNSTSAFMNLPDATKDGTGRWVSPGRGGSMAILGHVSRARVNWSAPQGKTQPPLVAGEFATVIFFAAATPPGLGSDTAGAGFSSRGTAFSSSAGDLATGTYNFPLPVQVSARGIAVYIQVSHSTGAGTARVLVQPKDSLSNVGAAQADSGALTVQGGITVMRLYPGITTSALSFSDILGQTPQLQLQIAVAPTTVNVDYDLLP